MEFDLGDITGPAWTDLSRKDLSVCNSSHDEWFHLPHPELETYQHRAPRPLLTPSPAAKLAVARARAKREEEYRQYLERPEAREASAKHRKRTRGKSLGKPQRIAVPSPSLSADATSTTESASARLGVGVGLSTTESASSTRLGVGLSTAESSVSSSSSSSRALDGPTAPPSTTTDSSSSSSSSSRNTRASHQPARGGGTTQSDKRTQEFASPPKNQHKRYFRKVARSPLAETQNRTNISESHAHAPTQSEHTSGTSVHNVSSSSSSSANAHSVSTSSSSSSSASARPLDQPRKSLRSFNDSRDIAAGALSIDHGSASGISAAVGPPRSPTSTSTLLTNKRVSQWGPPQRVLTSELPSGDPPPMENPEIAPEFPSHAHRRSSSGNNIASGVADNDAVVSHSQPSSITRAFADNEQAQSTSCSSSRPRSAPSTRPSAESLFAQRELPLPNLVIGSSPRSKPPSQSSSKEARVTSPDASSARPDVLDLSTTSRSTQSASSSSLSRSALRNLKSDIEQEEDLRSANATLSGRTDPSELREPKAKEPAPRVKDGGEPKELNGQRMSVWQRLAHGSSDLSKTQHVNDNGAPKESDKQRKGTYRRRHTTASGLLKSSHNQRKAPASTKRKRDPSDALEGPMAQGVGTSHQSELKTEKKRRKTQALIAAQRRDERVVPGISGGDNVSAASAAKKRRRTHKASGGGQMHGVGRNGMSEAQKKAERLKRSREYSSAVSEMRKRRKTAAPSAPSSSSAIHTSTASAVSVSTASSSGQRQQKSSIDPPKKPAPLFVPKTDAQTRSRVAARKRRCTTVPAAGISTTRAPRVSAARSVTSAVTRSKLVVQSSDPPNSKVSTSALSGRAAARSQSRARPRGGLGAARSSSRVPRTSQKISVDSKPSRFCVLEDRSSRSRSTASHAAKRSRLRRTKTAVSSKKPRVTRTRSALGSIDGNSQSSQNSAAKSSIQKSYRLAIDSDDSNLNKGIGGVQLDFSKNFGSKSRRRKTGTTKTSLRRSTRLRTRRGQSGSESSLSALPLSRAPSTSSTRTAKPAKTSSQIPSLLEKVGRGSSLDTLECGSDSKKPAPVPERDMHDGQSSTSAVSSSSANLGESSSRSIQSSRSSKKQPLEAKKRTRPSARLGAGKRSVSTAARRSAPRSRTVPRGDRSQSRARARGLNTSTKKSAATNSGCESDGSSFEMDAELQAKLREHNRRVRKSTTFDYVPQQHSRKDYAEWEKKTGKQWHQLTAAERTDLNHLIGEQKCRK